MWRSGRGEEERIAGERRIYSGLKAGITGLGKEAGEKEKGLLERLAEFWSAAPELGNGIRRIWRRAGNRKRARDRQSAESGGFLFSEEGGTQGFSLKRTFIETGQEKGQAGRAVLFPAEQRGWAKSFFAAEETREQDKRQEKPGIFSGEKREKPLETEMQGRKPLWAAEPSPAGVMSEMARTFFREEPENGGMERKALPLAGAAKRKRKREEEQAAASRREPAQKQEEESVFRQKEVRGAEQKQDMQIDIDGLMREMTKRLWEEREGCGRRLGG